MAEAPPAAAAPAAAPPADAEARRLHAVARRAAKDTKVEMDISKMFREAVRGGMLDAMMTEAFAYTQTQMDGLLGLSPNKN